MLQVRIAGGEIVAVGDRSVSDLDPAEVAAFLQLLAEGELDAHFREDR